MQKIKPLASAFQFLAPCSSRFLTISARCSAAHAIIGWQASMNDLPRSSMWYSTRGGTSAKTVRSMNKSSSRWRSVVVSTFCDMSGTARRMAENRMGAACSMSVCITSSDHLSPTRERTFRMGQLGKSRSLGAMEFSISFMKYKADWVISSPPYKKRFVAGFIVLFRSVCYSASVYCSMMASSATACSRDWSFA